ncbi:beta-lactamase regulator AmpE [Pseudoalteromonas sp. MMG024]|uniref:beta-lactamase regulator AmpE n=1 Tax=Pseudoalteromonas sp. MMG024 TaxID=2909980 RepID=UPI001F314BAC|nr:beta-lactamase regulator AmpE [Pseudoalteromonas sp. MMG024]MCF6456820.1 beta-lactamase regulator AmpE [Pseudoalteromonas sp. MMG024]
MILISVILALIIERLAAKEDAWQLNTYVKHFISISESNGLFSKIYSRRVDFFIWLLLPVLLLFAVSETFDFVLLELAINVVVLLVCFGCAYLREKYKGYLNALQRDDAEAATLYALQLGQKRTEQDGGETLGQTIAWINFRYYGAVIFWFVIFGVCGALGYALIRNFADLTRNDPASAFRKHKKMLHKTLYWLDWLPARIVSFGYLIIGNFSQGTATYLKYVFNFSVPNRRVIGDIAHAAERVEQEFIGCSFEAKCMVRLVKRNMLLMLAAIAILTLLGSVS